jgi:hypothetical protein
MANVPRGTGPRIGRKAVERTLRALLRLRQQASLKQLRGKINWQGDLEVMRRDR